MSKKEDIKDLSFVRGKLKEMQEKEGESVKQKKAKGPNQWVLFLKEKSKETGITYGCLISDPKIKDEYKKFKQDSNVSKTKSSTKTSKKKKKEGLELVPDVESPVPEGELVKEVKKSKSKPKTVAKKPVDKEEKKRKMAKEIKEEIEQRKGSEIDKEIIEKAKSDPETMKKVLALKNIERNLAAKTISKAMIKTMAPKVAKRLGIE